MTIEQWFEKAPAYFNGTMSTEEIRLFEMETAASDELSQLMQFWKSTDTEAKVYEQHKEDAAAFIATHQKLKTDFLEQEGNNATSRTPIIPSATRTFPVWKWVAVAAAVTGIIVLIKIFTPPPKNNTPVVEHKINPDTAKNIAATDSPLIRNPAPETIDRVQLATLYAQSFTPDDTPENPNGPLNDAFFYYESKQYKKAISAIDNAGRKAPTRGNDAFTTLTKFQAVYFKALSMMSLGNESGAIPLLKQSAMLAPSETLKAKAHWYLALAYIKQGEISSAGNTLQLVINNSSSSVYKRKAQKLLEAVNK